ncbi:hypothetical protein D9M68_717370 [compost metagenome]
MGKVTPVGQIVTYVGPRAESSAARARNNGDFQLRIDVVALPGAGQIAVVRNVERIVLFGPVDDDVGDGLVDDLKINRHPVFASFNSVHACQLGQNCAGILLCTKSLSVR